MANYVPSTKSIKGTNPQNLIENILGNKIYHSTFWKKQCFGLTAETLVDKAMLLDHVGGTYGGNCMPSPFMCLVMKMLEIQPDKEIVIEFIKNEDYKYVRILGAFYLRLTATDIDVYRYLEPLYNDYRKLRFKLRDGNFALTHVDEFIDELLTKDYSCDIVLPRIKKRLTVEVTGALEPRKSVLEDDFEEEQEDEDQVMDIDVVCLGVSSHSPTRKRGRDRKCDSHKHRDRDYGEDRGRGCDRDRVSYRVKDEREGRDRDRWYGSRTRNYSRIKSSSHARDSSSRGHSRRDYDQNPRKQNEKETKMTDNGTDYPDPGIAEANRIRASLGMKPLKI